MFSHSSLTRGSWEHKYFPVYYFPLSQVPDKYLTRKQTVEDGEVYDITVGDQHASGAAKVFSTPAELSGLIKIKFDAMDAWFEEEEQIYAHPKDPYKVMCTNVTVLQFADSQNSDSMSYSRHVMFESKSMVLRWLTLTKRGFSSKLVSQSARTCPRQIADWTS